MSENYIKKLVTEALTQVFTGEQQVTGAQLQQDVDLLKNYTQVSHRLIDSANTWKFEFQTEDKSYLSHVFVVLYPNGACKMRIEVDWKVKSKENTAGAGKDFVITFGPYLSYEEMVSELNRKLKNNSLIGSNLLSDNNDFQLDREMVELLKRLKENIAEIRSLNHPSLKTLERTYELIKDIPDEKGLYEFCKKNFVGWLLKQGMIYKLQNIDKIPFYRSFKKNHEITSKPFATKQ